MQFVTIGVYGFVGGVYLDGGRGLWKRDRVYAAQGGGIGRDRVYA